MEILELINSDEFIGKDVSIYLDGDSATELVEELIEEGEDFYPDFEDLDQDIVILSRVCSEDGVEWFVDGLYGEIGQVYNETEVALILEDVADEIDFDKVGCYEIYILELEDELEDLLEEMTQDVLEDIEDGECVYCAIKEQIRLAYQIGREEALAEIQDALDEIN